MSLRRQSTHSGEQESLYECYFEWSAEDNVSLFLKLSWCTVSKECAFVACVLFEYRFVLHFSHSTVSLQLVSYNLWNKINSLTLSDLNGCRWVNLPLNLEKYLFINNSQKFSSMSIQLTGNTCYFQTYLFTLLCKVGKPKISSDGRSIELQNVDLLEQATVSMLSFFSLSSSTTIEKSSAH